MFLLTRDQKFILICEHEFKRAARDRWCMFVFVLFTGKSENPWIIDNNSALFIQPLLQSRQYWSPELINRTERWQTGRIQRWNLPPFCKLLGGVPQIGRGNSNNTAGKPPSCVSVQEAPGVSTLAQVISLLMDHHCPSDHRHRSKERGVWLYRGVDLPLLRLKVTKVSGVVGVVFAVWVVVPTGGAAPLAQVPVLMDVDGRGLAVAEKAAKLKEGRESSLRVVLLEQHVTVHFGQVLWQQGAGSHVAGRIQAAIVLRGLRRSCRVTVSWAAILTTGQQKQQHCRRDHPPETQSVQVPSFYFQKCFMKGGY